MAALLLELDELHYFFQQQFFDADAYLCLSSVMRKRFSRTARRRTGEEQTGVVAKTFNGLSPVALSSPDVRTGRMPYNFSVFFCSWILTDSQVSISENRTMLVGMQQTCKVLR